MLRARSAFTLIELMMVVAMLAIVATAVVPKASNLLSGAPERNFPADLRQQAVKAQQQAVIYKSRFQLGFDSTNKQITIKGIADATQLQPNLQNNNSTKNVSSQPAQKDDPTAVNTKAYSLPDGVGPVSFQLSGQETAAENWQVTFYPDGTNDSASAVFSTSKGNKQLVLNPNGAISVIDYTGSQVSERWQAGSYEQR